MSEVKQIWSEVSDRLEAPRLKLHREWIGDRRCARSPRPAGGVCFSMYKASEFASEEQSSVDQGSIGSGPVHSPRATVCTSRISVQMRH